MFGNGYDGGASDSSQEMVLEWRLSFSNLVSEMFKDICQRLWMPFFEKIICAFF